MSGAISHCSSATVGKPIGVRAEIWLVAGIMARLGLWRERSYIRLRARVRVQGSGVGLGLDFAFCSFVFSFIEYMVGLGLGIWLE